MTVSAHRTGDQPGNTGDRYVLGVDFGTLSGRALVVRVSDGAELGSAVHAYSHGVIDEKLPATGAPLPPDWALQDPEDYRDVLRQAVPQAVREAGIDPAAVIGIGTDFTACTVMPVLRDGTPLCQLPGLDGRPHAYPKLWKHHAAQRQADRINALAHERGEPWIGRYGGKISSEWQFAKALQLLEEDPGSTTGRSAGSRRPTGSSGSCAAPRPATPAPPGTRASTRTATTRPMTTWPRCTRGSPASRPASWPTRYPRSAPGPAR